MSESDTNRYDNCKKREVWSCLLHSGPGMIRPVPGIFQIWLYMIIPGPDMIIAEPDMIIPDFTWSYLKQAWSYRTLHDHTWTRQNHASNCMIRLEADISLWMCKTGTIHESTKASFGVNSRSKNQINIGARQCPMCQILSWQKQMKDLIPQNHNKQKQGLNYKDTQNSRKWKFEIKASLKILVYIEVDQHLGCLKQLIAFGEDNFFYVSHNHISFGVSGDVSNCKVPCIVDVLVGQFSHKGVALPSWVEQSFEKGSSAASNSA